MFKAHKAPVVFCIFLLSVLTSACGGEKKTVVKEVVDDATKSEVVALNAKVLQLESMLSQLGGRVEDIDLGLMDVEGQIASAGENLPLLLIEGGSSEVLGRVVNVFSSGDGYAAFSGKGYYFTAGLKSGAIGPGNIYYASNNCVGTPHYYLGGIGSVQEAQGVIFRGRDSEGFNYFYSPPTETVASFQAGSFFQQSGCTVITSQPSPSRYRKVLVNDPAVTGFPEVVISSFKVL